MGLGPKDEKKSDWQRGNGPQPGRSAGGSAENTDPINTCTQAAAQTCTQMSSAHLVPSESDRAALVGEGGTQSQREKHDVFFCLVECCTIWL